MSDLIKLNIDGKDIQSKEGETILNIARKNNIFIPAICYLTRCSPTLACRLCLVEVDGKQVYSCNVKAKDTMQIKTTTANIETERKAIMEVYDVNHPLQCGVCDQSGDCELQNYTLYMKINSQKYTVKDVHRPASNWGVMNYDPGLCIVCEKCVTVCKDMVGSSALSTVKRNADPLDKSFKTSMPKDAYAMWNKLNKSLIGFDATSCVDCGECISVCPVGALVSNDFQYKSNSWELSKIPAANPHSSDCSFMYYEVKHESIINHAKQKIYRVTNEHHYSTLNGAGRFAYDFENKVEQKDEEEFNKAIKMFKDVETIKFNSYITNEEAYILQKLKDKLSCRLVNVDAYNYKSFLNEYSKNSGSSLYSSNLKDIHKSNFVISIGSYLKSDLPNARYAFNNSIVINKGAGLYFHPIKDPIMEKIGKRGKNIEFVYHKPLSEESILYLILYKFGKNLPPLLQEYISSLKETRVRTVEQTIKETIINVVKDENGEEKEVKEIVSKKISKEEEYEYISLLDDISYDGSLLDTIDKLLAKKDTFSLIVGEDVISHPNSKNLAKLCGLVDKYTDFKVVIIPSQTNTLGVSLICDLDECEKGLTIGYNEKATYELSALGDGNLDIPALNQQEGTFVNIDKKVIPTNAALPYKGYTLNDIANNILDIDVEHTIEYTKELPKQKGFKEIDFDDLVNNINNSSEDTRGYTLETFSCQTNDSFDKLNSSILKNLENKENETLIYRANPINQFNEFTAIAHEFQKNLESGLFVSKELMNKLNLQQNDKVIVNANNTQIQLNTYIDEQISGDIAYISTFDKKLNTKNLFNTYRYNTAVITKA